MEKLNDNDPMPFGKFRDSKMIDVPAWHLKWLKENISGKAPNKRSLAEKLVLNHILDKEESAKK